MHVPKGTHAAYLRHDDLVAPYSRFVYWELTSVAIYLGPNPLVIQLIALFSFSTSIFFLLSSSPLAKWTISGYHLKNGMSK